MKLIIDINEKDYNDIKSCNPEIETEYVLDLLMNCVDKGISIPDNATNGDVIKALFPRIKIKKYPTFLRVIEGEEYIPMTYDWWNSSYKRGDTEC